MTQTAKKPSRRRQRANKRNAQKSTGPRSSRGRATAALNALRHGFSASLDPDPETAAEIDALANAFLDGTSKDITAQGLAHEAAVAQIQMQNIVRFKMAAWQPTWEDREIERGGDLLDLERDCTNEAFEVEFGLTIDELKIRMPEAFKAPIDSEEERQMIYDLISIRRLSKFIRYERQFANQRDRALKALSTHVSTT